MKLISFYLPQFYIDEENNKNWGYGFTDWTSLKNAQSLFNGHNIIKPTELGYYDLSKDSIRHIQANLAQKYGVSAWCYYYYRFGDKKPLRMPLERHFKDKSLHMPFLICWANGDWTRTWDGRSGDILIKQKHTLDDDLNFIKDISGMLMDQRYFKINNKPVILIYRTELWSNIKETANIFKNYMINNFDTDLYLIRCNSFDRTTDPYTINFDASYQFPPFGTGMRGFLEKINPSIFDYNLLSSDFIKEQAPYKVFRCVVPSWDNSPRRKKEATIYLNANPQNYKNWLRSAISYTKENFIGEERIVFINAWNEWAEQAVLEPSDRWGREYLEATKQCLDEIIEYK